MHTVKSLVYELESGDNVISIPACYRFTIKTLSSQALNITLGGEQEFTLANNEVFDTGYCNKLLSTTCSIEAPDVGNVLVAVIC